MRKQPFSEYQVGGSDSQGGDPYEDVHQRIDKYIHEQRGASDQSTQEMFDESEDAIEQQSQQSRFNHQYQAGQPAQFSLPSNASSGSNLFGGGASSQASGGLYGNVATGGVAGGGSAGAASGGLYGNVATGGLAAGSGGAAAGGAAGGGAAAGGAGGAAGGAAGGGAAGGLAAAGPWAALAAAILINESEARDGGYRAENDGDYAKDLATGAVLAQDVDQRWADKMFGSDDEYGFGADTRGGAELASGDLSHAWDNFKDGTLGKVLGGIF